MTTPEQTNKGLNSKTSAPIPSASTQMTSQQISDMKANSPEYQSRQYWQGIFSDFYICGRYTSAFNSDAIKVPSDPIARQVAMQVAQEVVTNYANRSDTIAQSGDEYYSKDQVCAKAAQKFIRKCQAYVRNYSAQNDKQTRQSLKQNPGLGTYEFSEFAPADPNNKLAIKEAAVKAGNTIAYYDLLIESGDKNAEQRKQQAEQYIKPQLKEKRYATYYLYTYCAAARFQDATRRNKVTQTINDIKSQYEKYENELRGSGDPNKDALKSHDQNKLNMPGYGRS